MIKIPAIFGLLLILAACDHQTEAGHAAMAEQPAQAPAAPASSGNTISYKTYCNTRYGFCVDYPEAILYPQGESGSGDGETFSSKDGGNTLLAYRDLRDNMDPDVKFVIGSAYKEDLKTNETSKLKHEITYQKLVKNFYVISGYNGDKVFYQKTMMSDSQLVTCILTYNQSDKALYDRVSEQVFKSFK